MRKNISSNVQKLINIMDSIDYGYLDLNGKKHTIIDSEFSNLYRLQSPKQFMNSKIGVCWDQVEFERYYFKKCNIKHNTYFIVYYDDVKNPSHTFLTYENNDKYIWFENSWEKYKGVHEYETLCDLLKDVKNKFIINEIKGKIIDNNLCIYKYVKPKFKISCLGFYKHCEQGENIII